jgi:UDP-GlcNAc:undecaprenyl-phosphate GlcNAc-1-phosphate transferase
MVAMFALEFDTQLLYVALRAFVITLILTPVCRDVFSSYSIVDAPDQGRKLHGKPIPRVGGIAIFIGYVLSFLIFDPNLDQKVENELSLVFKLFPAVVLVFAVGLLDDFIGLKPWQKLAGQTVAAGMAYWAGVRVLGVGGYSADGMLQFPVTMAWLLVCTNALNLIDGLDGLAAGIGLFATVTIFIAALLHGNTALAFATLPLAGSLMGFLCFNFNPATIFLGDGGSLLLGFLLGCYGAIWSQKSVTLLGMIAPLMVLCLPLLDVALCVLRRFLRSRPIFSPDRGHIHHRLVDRGLSPRSAVFVIYGLTALAAAVSLLQGFAPNPYLAAAVGLALVAVLWGAVRFLGYAEFVFAGRILRTGGLQRLLTARIEIEEFRGALNSASTATGVWPVLAEWYPRLGFDGVVFEAGGAVQRAGDPGGASCWTVQASVSPALTITFVKRHGAGNAPVVISSLVELLHDTLREKAPPAVETEPSLTPAVAHVRG